MLPYVVEVGREQLDRLKDLLLRLPNIKPLPTTNPYEAFRLRYGRELIIGYTSCKVVANGPLAKDLLTELTMSRESARYDRKTKFDKRVKKKLLIAYIDGLCEPKNPGGIASYGLVIYSGSNKIHEDAKVIGEGRAVSNNVAEYSALVALLQYLIHNNIEREVLVRSDSELVINQMLGMAEVKDGLYVEKWYESRQLMKDVKAKLQFEWIPRKENSEADRLSRLAYEDYCKTHGLEVKYRS